jgi:type I restriction enzyme S subunit
MELKLGYKRSDVGVIPHDWEPRRVGVMGEVRAGKALAVRGAGEQRPYLRTKNVFDGRIDLNDVLRLPMTDTEFSRYRLRYGDVLLNEGQSIELVGRCAMYKNEYPEPCAIQNQLIRFRAREGVSPDFATHLFRHCQKTGLFTAVALQTTSVAHLGVSRFENLQLAWPVDATEQEAIAEALSDADALIESLEQLIAKKGQIKQGAMQELLTGKKRLPRFDGEWTEKPLNQVCWFQEGPGVRNTQFTASGIKLLNGTNIVRGVLNLNSTSRFISESEAHGAYAHFLADAGDIVIASSGITIEQFHEKVAFVREHDLPFCMNTSTIRFKPFTGVLASDFLFQFLTSFLFKRAIGGQATG